MDCSEELPRIIFENYFTEIIKIVKNNTCYVKLCVSVCQSYIPQHREHGLQQFM